MGYTTPSLSVIVATYNRPKSLERLLGLLNDQRCVDFGLIDCCVVDDGSDQTPVPIHPSDDEWRLIDLGIPCKFAFHYLYRKRHPQNWAQVYSCRNRAADWTHGEYVLQLDDDVEFQPYLLNLLQSLAGVVSDEHYLWSPRISNNIDIDKEGTPFQRGADGRWYDGRVFWHETHFQSTDSSGMFMPRRTWEAVGGYSEELDGTMGFGDQELALKVQKLGKQRGDVKIMLGPYFVNKADDESGSWRMTMINRAMQGGRPLDNWEMLVRKHPDWEYWNWKTP